MKKVLLLSLIALSLFSCSEGNEAPSNVYDAIIWGSFWAAVALIGIFSKEIKIIKVKEKKRKED